MTNKQHQNKISNAFWAGIIGWVGFMSLYEDAIGQEGLMHRIQEHWIRAAYSVPMGIVMLLISAGLYWLALRNEEGE